MNENSILALGGNADSLHGKPQNTIEFALKWLETKGVFTLKMSSLYVNPAFPAGSGPDFLNAAALIQSDLTPDALLSILHEAEAACGRVREVRWGPRTLDIDLIAQGYLILPSREKYLAWRDLSAEKQQQIAPEELILPHPRIQDRAFVLIPMADVAPEWIHPVSGLSVAQMVSNLSKSEREDVVAL